MTEVTPNVILEKLKIKVSTYDARIILDSAMVISGLRSEWAQPLKKEDAQALCMQLMRRGGPAFHVGTEVYKQL